MRLRRAEAAATAEYRGRTYYFCLRDHRDAFMRDPERYLAIPEQESDAGAQSDVGLAQEAGADGG